MKYVVVDYISSFIAFLLFDIVRYELLGYSDLFSLWDFMLQVKMILEQFLFPLFMLGVYWISGFYNNPVLRSRLEEFSVTVYSALFNTLIIFLLLMINDTPGMHRVGYLIILSIGLLLFVCTYIGRHTITMATSRMLRNRKWLYTTLIIGNSERSRDTYDKLTGGSELWTHNVVGFIRIPGEPNVEDHHQVWDISDLEGVCAEYHVDQVVIAPVRRDDKHVMQILDRCFPLDVNVGIDPDILSYVTSDIRLDDIMGIPMVSISSPRISEFQKNVKRSLDVVASALALLLLSPMLLVVGFAVKLTSKGPVFYVQERIGRHQRPFKIYKFRSMYVDAEQFGPCLSSEHDPRVTRVGHTLRKYRIDEIPQFFNVIKGDMSLVGPRPERDFYIQRIVKHAPYYRLLFQVRPGITSWGMVKYGYAENVEQMVRRSAFDLIYLNNMSLSTDLKIMIYTVRTVIKGAGQ